MAETAAPEFRVYTGRDVRSIILNDRQAIINAVEDAYRAHHRGHTANPNSTFVRFPDNARNRIIALPASLRPGQSDSAPFVSGIKWIASFPGNRGKGLERASAVLVLNDHETGYPIACMEASCISAARTAASAASALKHLIADGPAGPCRVAVIGAGLISRHIIEFVLHAGVGVARFTFFDLSPDHAHELAREVHRNSGIETRVASSAAAAIEHSEVVVFATTATEPHICDPALLRHNPIVLHISLRDLSPEIVLRAYNIVDDVDHCLTARTSLHLTEMQVGHRDFVHTTLPAVLSGAPLPPRDRPIIFSPFGMGILDIAVGAIVHKHLRQRTSPVADFFVTA